MAFRYQFSMYSFQDSSRAAAAQESMDRMSADGWHMHTTIMNFTEVAVMWEREADSDGDGAKSPRSRPRARKPEAADG
jgi:hypothetical protein